MRNVDSHLDKPMLLESNQYGKEIIGKCYPLCILILGDKGISKYMCDCWITGYLGSLDELTIERTMHF